MIVVSTDSVPGSEITEAFGLVRGNAVRAKHIGRDIMAAIKNIVGGELGAYSELMQETREQATQRMISEAEALGADAVVSVRYTTAAVANAAAEILSYGTAVKLR
jgi:uncharacterized protein YbjQ (UPF0145 family)